MNPRTSHRLALIAASSLALGACTVGPNYQRLAPAAPPPGQFKELAGWTQALPSDDAPKGDWWTGFNDPLLDQLEPQVRVSNQTVRQDYANYQQALALVRGANAQLYPTLGVSGSAARSGSFGNSSSGAAPNTNQFQLEATASWTPDLWGKVRRTIEENSANAQASEATLANEILSEQVALANAIINLRVADANIDLLSQNVTAYKEYLRVVSTAVATGYKLYAPSDEAQARSQLETAQSSLLSAGIARAQYVHAIAVLVGKNPEDLDVAHDAQLPNVPQIPVGVPSTLLQRRPDIAAAERTMKAENATIGIAVSAYYPDVSLSGAAGVASAALGNLFTAASTIWSIGASATETVLDFGARRAQVDAAKAAYNAAIASYRSTVLSAFQSVEDNLVSLRILAQQDQVLDGAIRDAAHATRLAQSEYQVGTIDYTAVATAQVSEIVIRQNALAVHQSQLIAAVDLIGNLGGGWSADQLHDPHKVSKEKAAAGMP